NEVTEFGRLDQAALAAKTPESSLERLSRSLLGFIPTALHAPRASAANAIPIRPLRTAVRCELEDLSLLKHIDHPRRSRATVVPRSNRRDSLSRERAAVGPGPPIYKERVAAAGYLVSLLRTPFSQYHSDNR